MNDIYTCKFIHKARYTCTNFYFYLRQIIVLFFSVFLPAPIVFGKLFDGACKVWKNSCSSRGACKLYDIEAMRHVIVSMEVGLRIAALLLYIAAYLVGIREARKAKNKDGAKTDDITLEIKPPAV